VVCVDDVPPPAAVDFGHGQRADGDELGHPVLAWDADVGDEAEQLGVGCGGTRGTCGGSRRRRRWRARACRRGRRGRGARGRWVGTGAGSPPPAPPAASVAAAACCERSARRRGFAAACGIHVGCGPNVRHLVLDRSAARLSRF
jgi:hypothetical protein